MKALIIFLNCVWYACSNKHRKKLNSEAIQRIYQRTGITRHPKKYLILKVACSLSELGIGSVWLGEERITRTINKIKLIM